MIEPGQLNLRLRRAIGKRRASAEAAVTDRRTASGATRTAGASGATTSSATATAATTATAAATTTTAAPRHLLRTGSALFLVEQMEGGETDVGDLFFAKQDALCRREIQFLCCVRGRQSRCRGGSSERECQSGSAQCRDCGFGHTLPLRSLLHWHSRILQPVRPVFRFQPQRSYAQATDRARPSILTNALLCIQFPFILMNAKCHCSARRA